MPTNPNTLMDNARCIDNCIPVGMQMAVLIGLIDALGAVGGGSTIGFQNGVPVVPPTTTSQVSLSINLLTGLLYYWNPTTQAWTLVTTGSSTNSGYSGNYAGGVPSPVPTSTLAMAIDTSNNAVWLWFGAAWHDTGMQTA